MNTNLMQSILDSTYTRYHMAQQFAMNGDACVISDGERQCAYGYYCTPEYQQHALNKCGHISDDFLKPQYRNLPIYFWVHLQSWHDALATKRKGAERIAMKQLLEFGLLHPSRLSYITPPTLILL